MSTRMEKLRVILSRERWELHFGNGMLVVCINVETFSA